MAYLTWELLLGSVFCCFYPISSQRLNFETSWQNCNRSYVPLYVHNLTIDPDPVWLDKYILIQLHLSLDRNIGENNNRLDVDLDLRLKTDRGYTEVCAILGEDKCHFSDVCTILKDDVKDKCPAYIKEKYHNNCTCPFMKNEYNLLIPIPPQNLPFVLRGKFDAKITLKEQEKHLGCVEITFCVSACKPLNSGHIEQMFMDILKQRRLSKSLI